MTFPEFIASKRTISWPEFLNSRIASESCVEPDWFASGEVKEVLLYEGQYFIFSLADGSYTLTADRSMVSSDHLEKLEIMLYLEVSDDNMDWAY